MSWTHTKEETRSTTAGIEYEVVFTHDPSGTTRTSTHFFVTGHDPQSALDSRAAVMDEREKRGELVEVRNALEAGDDISQIPYVFSTQSERERFLARQLVNVYQDEPDEVPRYNDFLFGFTDAEFAAFLDGATVAQVVDLRAAVVALHDARRDYAHSIPRQRDDD